MRYLDCSGLGDTGVEKNNVSCTSWTCSEERGKSGEATLDDWANGGSVEFSVHMVRMVLVVWAVGVILGNGYGI